MVVSRVLTVLALTVPVAALGACSGAEKRPQPAGSSPASATAAQPGAQALSARLVSADGTPVAEATFDFTDGPDGYATITVETTAEGVLAPGFHHMHIHAVGACEPDSVGPDGGERGDFLSAGPHYQAPGRIAQPPSGDLPALLVREDGAALLTVATDLVTRDELLAGDGTSLMLHGAEHADDAHERVACGVIGTR